MQPPRCQWWRVLPAVAAACAMLSGAEVPDGLRGSKASLRLTDQPAPFPPRLEQGLGRTQIVLNSEPDGRELYRASPEGRWQCFGFRTVDQAFLMGGENPRGAWIPLTSIRRLKEDGTWSATSAFDREGFLALAAALSPNQRFLVFIGGKGSVDGLYVLDLDLDSVRKLGRPPAPPPDPELTGTCGSAPFAWGTCWADRFMAMDAGILHFPSAEVLEVSYGRDGPRQRARKRTIHRFSLVSTVAPQAQPQVNVGHKVEGG